LTDEQIEEKCKHISYILTEVIKIEGITQEVLEGVQSGQYADESIRLHDLLNPSQSPITSFQANASTMKFAQAFKNAFEGGMYVFASNYTNANYNELVNIIEQEKLSIYFPYSENWQGAEKPTLTYNTVEEKNENLGYAPVLNNNTISNFVPVTVNDDYADANAVWVVRGQEIYTPIEQDGTDDHIGVDSVATTACPQFEKNYSVQISEVRVVDQLDNFFGRNCGGSDMYFVLGVLLNPNDDKPKVEEKFLGEFTRKQCRKGTWVSRNTDLLAPWETKNRHVLLGLYEWDQKVKVPVEITGSASVTTTTSGQTANTNSAVKKDVKYQVVSKNEVQYQVTWERCEFFKKIKQPSPTSTNNGFTLGGELNGWRRFVGSSNVSEFILTHE
jgi:hypothetical protein